MRLTILRRAIQFANMAHELKAKRPRYGFNNSSETSYFDSYADITVHEEMLGDSVRTNAYKDAIFNCNPPIKDKVVLDVGAGTGILSCFCAQAGAKTVYAVEASKIAEQAKQVVKANGLGDKVVVIQGLLEEVELPEKVDVIVSEWMGYCLLYESMLSSVINARDRWLKPGGLILPSHTRMFLSPVSDDEIIIEKVNFWSDMHEAYGVDMSTLLPFARTSMSKDIMVKTITCENILSNSQLVASFDLYNISHEDIVSVQHDFKFHSFGIADLQGFALWFDVSFEVSNQKKQNYPETEKQDDRNGCNAVDQIESSDCKNGNLILSTSPYDPETHWKQSLLYLNAEVPVVQDSKINGKLNIKRCENNHRFLDISLSCSVDDKPETDQTYFMGYELPKNNNTKI
uniref:Protein arginine N-methyltransferase 6 n=1 Tax=Phallusia mammillata TaxID=59560 RepID=A0A6F9DP15_9ASCI|nr:protein arginine N-methyltransferase 6 [Phallusia mammillata]